MGPQQPLRLFTHEMEPFSVVKLHLRRKKIEIYDFLSGFPGISLQFGILEDSEERLGKYK